MKGNFQSARTVDIMNTQLADALAKAKPPLTPQSVCPKESEEQEFDRLDQQFPHTKHRLEDAQRRLTTADEKIADLQPKIKAQQKIVDQHGKSDHPHYRTLVRNAQGRLDAFRSDLQELQQHRECMQRLVDSCQKAWDEFPHKRYDELKKINDDILASTSKQSGGRFMSMAGRRAHGI